MPPQSLVDEAKKNGVTLFKVNFEGGNDEGYITVHSYPDNHCVNELLNEWANDITYSGAGDGTPYGDNYEYDLEKMTAMHTQWFYELKQNDPDTEPLITPVEE